MYSFKVDNARWFVVLGLFKDRGEATKAIINDQVKINGKVVPSVGSCHHDLELPFTVEIEGRNKIIINSLEGVIENNELRFSPLQGKCFVL